MRIRPVDRASEADRAAVWRLFEPVIRAGETYPYPRDMAEAEALSAWVDKTRAAYLAEDESGAAAGSYYLRDNQPGLGSHVANAGFLVAPEARGQGVGRRMGEHALEEAKRLGYRAMQFNLVVATNEASVRLWPSLGFDVVGRLPGAFVHPAQGEVDALVMYRRLDVD
ncbi:MAG: GNAT family N-acetyltransferase [Planctomycetota bacterium]